MLARLQCAVVLYWWSGSWMPESPEGEGGTDVAVQYDAVGARSICIIVNLADGRKTAWREEEGKMRH